MALNVGQGIKDQMSGAGDEPARDSDFGSNQDGTSWEKGHGFLGDYIASNASGAWRSAGPLPVAG